MRPGKRRCLGFSPFLRSLSRLPPPPLRSCMDSLLSLKDDDQRTPPDLLDQGESHEDDDDEENEELPEEIVQVDFSFFDPKPGDFNGIRLLLRNYLDKTTWDLSGFVDLILEQTTVGTVVKGDNSEEGGDSRCNPNVNCGDDDNGLYAVISALNLGRYASHTSIEQIKEYVLAACKEEALKAKLKLLLGEQAKDVGLLVCERFVNFPIQAVLPLYEGLFDEVGWATEDEPTKEACDSFRFKFYLLVSRIYVNNKAPETNVGKVSLARKNIFNKSKRRSCEEESIVYIKAEDEIFHKLSSMNFIFDLQSCRNVPPEMKNYKKAGLVMLVESHKVSDFRKELTHIAQS